MRSSNQKSRKPKSNKGSTRHMLIPDGGEHQAHREAENNRIPLQCSIHQPPQHATTGHNLDDVEAVPIVSDGHGGGGLFTVTMLTAPILRFFRSVNINQFLILTIVAMSLLIVMRVQALFDSSTRRIKEEQRRLRREKGKEEGDHRLGTSNSDDDGTEAIITHLSLSSSSHHDAAPSPRTTSAAAIAARRPTTAAPVVIVGAFEGVCDADECPAADFDDEDNGIASPAPPAAIRRGDTEDGVAVKDTLPKDVHVNDAEQPPPLLLQTGPSSPSPSAQAVGSGDQVPAAAPFPTNSPDQPLATVPADIRNSIPTPLKRGRRRQPNGGGSSSTTSPLPPPPDSEPPFDLSDPLLPQHTDYNSLSDDALWSADDVALKRLVVGEARDRCRPRYLGVTSLASSSSSNDAKRSRQGGDANPLVERSWSDFKYPPAVGTRVFGFGVEGGLEEAASSDDGRGNTIEMTATKKKKRAHTGQWVRFWIASVDGEGHLLCNGGAFETVSREQVLKEKGVVNPAKLHDTLLSLPPLEDLYDIALEAVPHDTLASMVVSSQMPDGMGFDEHDDVKSDGGVGRQVVDNLLQRLDPTHPNSFRAVTSGGGGGSSNSGRTDGVVHGASNYFAGFRSYYGDEKGVLAAYADPELNTTVAINDGAYALDPRRMSKNTNDRSSENAGLPVSGRRQWGLHPSGTNGHDGDAGGPSTVRSTKIAVTRSLYIGYGLTEVHAYVRHAGVYDLCATIVQTGASNGLAVTLSAEANPTASLRPRYREIDSDTVHFDIGLFASDGASAAPQPDGVGVPNVASPAKVESLDGALVTRSYLEKSGHISELIADRQLYVDNPFVLADTPLTNRTAAAADGVPPTSSGNGHGVFGADHIEVRYQTGGVFRCVSGTFIAPPSPSPTNGEEKKDEGSIEKDSSASDVKTGSSKRLGTRKPLCTAPLSAFPSAEVYKNRFRRGHWLQLRDGVCDGEEHCLVAHFDGRDNSDSESDADDADAGSNRGLPVGFSPAPSQSFWALLRTEGWLWASDACVMVFFHQDGIAERLLNNQWTAAWGPSVIKQPLANFIEYRLGRPIFSNPLPVFMDELPRHKKRKGMPGFFSYRQWVAVLNKGLRRIGYASFYDGHPIVSYTHNGSTAPPQTRRRRDSKGTTSTRQQQRQREGAGSSGSGALLPLSSTPNSDDYKWLAQLAWAGCPNVAMKLHECRANIGMLGTFGKVQVHAEFRAGAVKTMFEGPDGAIIKALLPKYLSGGDAGGSGGGGSTAAAAVNISALTPERLAEMIQTLQLGYQPMVPSHFLLDFSIWRWPHADDAHLEQIASTLRSIEKLHTDATAVVDAVWRQLNITTKVYEEGLSDAQRLLVPRKPVRPLMLWHTAPAIIAVDDNLKGSALTRSQNILRQRHYGWSLDDAFHRGKPYANASADPRRKRRSASNNASPAAGTSEAASSSSLSSFEDIRPSWEDTHLSQGARLNIKSIARDNPFFIIMPRFEMTYPFHVGNRYGHLGVHYGSTSGMCATGGARPGYELAQCLRKVWADDLLAEMWLNAFVSHTESTAP